MYVKFIVLKVDDINKYLIEEEKNNLENLIHKIQTQRQLEGKKINQYIVINMDEPYSLIVSELISIAEGHKSKQERRLKNEK